MDRNTDDKATMTLRRTRQWLQVALALAGAGLAVLAGCSTSPTVFVAIPADASGVTKSSNFAMPSSPIRSDDRPPAIFKDESISWDELRPRILEDSGGQVLEELLLERLLRQALRDAKIEIDSAAIALEEKAALEALSSDPARAAQLLVALRDAQSLGPNRWNALLWRNAALRALASREITVTEETIRQAFDAVHGPRRVARLIVVTDISTVERVRSRLVAGESFAEVAAQMSIDSSAARGGLLAPITRLDPSFPPAFREALFNIKPSEISAAILLDNGYAIVQLREEIAGDDTDPAKSRPEDERAARRAQERVEMDRIARSILRDVKPTVFDDALLDSWRRLRNRPK